MVVNNTASAIGDVITVFSQVAISADTVALTGFSDVTNNETGTKFFVKTFRFSIDGINFSSWNVLNNGNLAAISGTVVGLLFLEFRYERSGTDTTGTIDFVSINITGNGTVHVCLNTASLNTIFEDLVGNNTITADICSNLLEKIYKGGIVPQYILRIGDDGASNDYVAFWSGVCFYFSLFISFISEFDNLFQTKDYLKEYMAQKGIYFCDDITFGDLQYISSRFLDEIRKRGTMFVVRNKGFVLQDATTVDIDGEWLRILCQNDWDEFLVELAGVKQRPWYIGNNSPMYNGTLRSMQLNKTKENTEAFVNLTKYDLVGSGNITIQAGNMNLAGTGLMGIGFDISSPPVGLLSTQTIKVEPEMDYEITFRLRRNSATFGNLIFGCLAFNQHDVYKTLGLLDINTLGVTNTFINDGASKVCREIGEFYYIRGIIYAQNSIALGANASKTNIGLGLNMQFNLTENIKKIVPCIAVTNGAAIDYDIFDYKVRPLIKGKNILPLQDGTPKNIKNPNFIQSTATIYSYMKNNSKTLSDEDVNKLIEKFLIPYQNKLVTVNLIKQQI